jgi:hypothetical protein
VSYYYEDPDEDESDTWVPPPPDDDDDLNPVEVARVEPEPEPEPVRLALVVPIGSIRQRQAERIAGKVREVIDEVGVPGVLAAILEQIQQTPSAATSTCPHCRQPMLLNRRSCGRCEGARNRERVERMAESIRELKRLSVKGDPDPERERTIIMQLRESGHPDLDALTRWCSATREKAEHGGGKEPARGKRW